MIKWQHFEKPAASLQIAFSFVAFWYSLYHTAGGGLKKTTSFLTTRIGWELKKKGMAVFSTMWVTPLSHPPQCTIFLVNLPETGENLSESSHTCTCWRQKNPRSENLPVKVFLSIWFQIPPQIIHTCVIGLLPLSSFTCVYLVNQVGLRSSAKPTRKATGWSGQLNDIFLYSV